MKQPYIPPPKPYARQQLVPPSKFSPIPTGQTSTPIRFGISHPSTPSVHAAYQSKQTLGRSLIHAVDTMEYPEYGSQDEHVPSTEQNMRKEDLMALEKMEKLRKSLMDDLETHERKLLGLQKVGSQTAHWSYDMPHRLLVCYVRMMTNINLITTEILQWNDINEILWLCRN